MAANAPLAPPPPRRVSYVVPLPASPPPVLSLPPLGLSRRGHPGPLYAQHFPPPSDAIVAHAKFVQDEAAHPRHRLAVQALALDLSTAVSSASAGEPAPSGILYTGGRDGLVSSWELGLPTRKRKRRYGRLQRDEGVHPGSDSGSSVGSSDDEDEPTWEVEGADLNLGRLGPRPVSSRSQRRSSKPRGRSRSASSTSTRKGSDPVLPIEEAWEIDDDRIRIAPAPTAKFRQCLQSHTDWVNDIVLCDYNRTLVSASSDSLLVAWNPHSTSYEDQVTPHYIGRHGDYVRCLASARDARWVASGGFDRKIKLWDISEGRTSPLLELPSPPASIYSIAATDSGTLLAAGSPERVIRVWDPRSRNQVARLGGHTDNVRAVLLSDDGKWVLSASSDATVKLWSLSGQRCLHTFSHHSSSVWSLFSQHPTFERFYSGDRSGIICKIDLEGTGDPGEGECVVLARDSAEESNDVRPGGEGITQIVGQDDSYIWTAGGSSSVKRWRDIAPRGKRSVSIRTKADPALESLVDERLRTATPPIPESPPEPPVAERDRSGLHNVSFLQDLTSTLSRTTSSPTPRLASNASSYQFGTNRPSSLRTRPTPTGFRSSRHPSDAAVGPSSGNSTPGINPSIPGANATTLFEIPYDSLVPLTSPDDSYFSPSYPRGHDAETSTIYSTTSVVSVPLAYGSSLGRAVLSASPQNQPRPVSLAETTFDADNQAAMIARRDYIERESATEGTPLRSAPDDIIAGRVGLIRCELLNDRRHAVTIDTDNDVLLWDIVEARCLGIFLQSDIVPPSRRPSDTRSTASSSESANSGSEAATHDVLDYVRERIEGEGSAASWCKCDTRVGALTIHLEEPRVFDGEVYVDEAHLGPTNDFPADHRLSMGKWVLRNLFHLFIEAEVQLRANAGSPGSPSGRPAEPPRFISLADLAPPSMAVRSAKTPGMTIALATPAARKAVLPTLPIPSSTLSPRNTPWDLTPIPPSPGTPRFPDSHTPFRSSHGTPLGALTPTPVSKSEDYFSLPPSASEPVKSSDLASIASPTLPTPGGTLMGRLRNLGKGSKRPSAGEIFEQLAPAAAQAEPVANGIARSVEEEQQHRILEAVFSHPITPCPSLDAPPLRYDPNMAILLSEETADASAWAVTYRGLVGTGKADLNVLEQKSPLWLLDFLLGNRAPLKDPVKISFVIQPWIDTVRAGLPELPNANARLTANRSLRIRKVMGYVADKLELRESRSRAASIAGGSLGESTDVTNGTIGATEAFPVGRDAAGDFIPEEQIEILCGDVLLTSRQTLATIRTHYWRSGGDVVLSYRQKQPVLQAPR